MPCEYFAEMTFKDSTKYMDIIFFFTRKHSILPSRINTFILKGVFGPWKIGRKEKKFRK